MRRTDRANGGIQDWLTQDSSRIDNFFSRHGGRSILSTNPPATCIVPKRCEQVGTRPVGHYRLARADTRVFDSPAPQSRGPLLLFIELDVYTLSPARTGRGALQSKGGRTLGVFVPRSAADATPVLPCG